MLTCPVCRSQNMDTAKFCGNCGTPFPRSPVLLSSSLVNCAQGHIYSAVYEHCPYCPQPDQSSSNDLATRVEGGEAPRESRSIKDSAPKATPLATRTEMPETVLDSTSTKTSSGAPGSAMSGANDATRIEPRSQPAPLSAPADSEVIKPESKVLSSQELRLTGQASRTTSLIPLPEEELEEGKGKIVGWLITYTRNRDGQDFKLRAGLNRIGAHPGCDIVISDETVSGSHALIVHRDGHCLIKDELSRNGTFVNGVEVVEARILQNYDQIRIGNTILTYVSAERLSE